MLTLGDNRPSRRGLTWRRGYEGAASSAWDKDRPPFPSPLCFLLPLLTSSLTPSDSGLGGQPPSPALSLACHPRPRVFTLHFSLIAHFCKLVSISMLHLLPFNIFFARPCRKKRGAQQKASPPAALVGNILASGLRQKARGRGAEATLPAEAPSHLRQGHVLLLGA